MLHAERIAAASPRIGALVMGTSDLTKDLQARHTRERLPLVTSLGICLLAARAFDIAILDGVHLELDDAEAFEASCRQGREMGFDGKTLIHPNQVGPANRIFGPVPEDVVRARRIIDAHAQASREGKGVVVVDGRLVENLHVQEAKRTLQLDEAIRKLDEAAA
jgi:citrate lyase subunit beta/citryl-CoA lyase